MKRIPAFAVQGFPSALFLLGVTPPVPAPSFGPTSALAQEGWRAEHEQVCSKSDVAMTLSPEELRVLIARWDKLRPQIEAEEESTRKVYLRRLQMCRDLYKYVLENKEQK